MKKQFFSRAAVCALALLMVLIPVFAVTAGADGLYSIPSADVDITLLENGDAEIRESWVVEYREGAFPSFSRRLRFGDDLKGYEKISYIEFWEYSIGDVPVPHVEDASAGAAQTWNFIQEDSYIDMNWFGYFQAGSRVKFSCRYVLKEVVHRLREGNAVFSYCLIDESFDVPIDKTNVTIHLPGAAPQIMNYSAQGTEEIGEDSVSFLTESHSGMQKYIITMDSALFGTLPKSGTSERFFEKQKAPAAAEVTKAETAGTVNENTGGGTLGLVIVAAMLGGLVWWVVALAFRLHKEDEEYQFDRKQKERETFLKILEANPGYVAEIVQKLAESGVSSVELACSIAWLNQCGTIFMVGMLCEMVNEGNAKIDEKAVWIKNRIYSKDYQREFVSAMVSGLVYQERDGFLYFDLQEMVHYLAAKSNYDELFKELDAIAAKMRKPINGALKEEYQIVARYYVSTGSHCNLTQLLQLAKECGRVDPVLIAGLFVNPTADDAGGDSVKYLAWVSKAVRDKRIGKKSSGISGAV